MFSHTAEYALRAAVSLAENGGHLTNAEVAARTQVPAHYLSKVLQQLAKAGVVQAVRGKYGGYRLARPCNRITVLEVVAAVDPLERITRCPLDRPEHAHALCPLHRSMDDALALVEQRLGTQTLADLVTAAGTPEQRLSG